MFVLVVFVCVCVLCLCLYFAFAFVFVFCVCVLHLRLRLCFSLNARTVKSAVCVHNAALPCFSVFQVHSGGIITKRHGYSGRCVSKIT